MPAAPTRLARAAVGTLGGRFSTELGIDVDAGPEEVERWFLAATLFGNRISFRIAERTYRALASRGIATIADVEGHSWDELVEALDSGGYVRYDFRTATRLQQLANAVRTRHGGQIGALGTETGSESLEAALDALPGWGPTTVRVFLRELRGVWPGARPRLDERARAAAEHLGLLEARQRRDPLAAIRAAATKERLDLRDLEAALVRLSLLHRRDLGSCPGAAECHVLAGALGRADHSS